MLHDSHFRQGYYSGVCVPSSKTALHLLASKFFFVQPYKAAKVCHSCVHRNYILHSAKKKSCKSSGKGDLQILCLNYLPTNEHVSSRQLDHCFAFTRFTFLNLCEPNSVLPSLKNIKFHVRNIVMAKGKSL